MPVVPTCVLNDRPISWMSSGYSVKYCAVRAYSCCADAGGLRGDVAAAEMPCWHTTVA
jgi:hypothetical protein